MNAKPQENKQAGEGGKNRQKWARQREATSSRLICGQAAPAAVLPAYDWPKGEEG